ncbi:hypothetical protein lerEdw1_000506 [Lerista edwardsae]|nr:hypothetical protein lerEdw1_000506 [Lerista edwardsae]
MSLERNSRRRHHNPVDSLHRKIRTINMLDQASNPALQIPKFQSKNFDSPQNNMKKNLEEILKKRTLKTSDHDNRPNSDTWFLSPGSDVFSLCPQMATPSPRHISDIHSANATFSVDRNKEKLPKLLLTVDQEGSSPPLLFRHRDSVSGQLLGSFNAEQKGVSPCDRNRFTSSPNLSAWQLTPPQPVFQTPMAKRPPVGRRVLAETKEEEENPDASLISEEDLLTTIFCLCDVERRGKVSVSKIVDFLRHTTSRGPDDSNLEELCSMLDPDQRDISMDLETYHAIMKEWIEDCRRNWKEACSKETTTDVEEPAIKLQESSLAAKRTPVRMNVTYGSMEAIGGDVSRGDLETSDLITCVADLQFNNQKLHEENSQLKLALDALEEANNRLLENIEELRNQIKSFQQSMNGMRNLKEELEEAKSSLHSSEEIKMKILAQKKQLEKENQSLILKISSLQEENIRNALDSDGLQKTIVELSQNMAELQMQVHLYENTVANKDTALLKKDSDIQELKSALKEYSSVIETLRVEKNKLVNNIQQMQQELISNGINIPLLCKFNSNSSILEGSNSLHCELELAQEQSQISEWTPLDESLDREVLLLLHGPEQVGEKFKSTIQKLQEELSQLEDLAGLHPGLHIDTNVQEAYEKKLVVKTLTVLHGVALPLKDQDLKQHLGNKRTIWLQKLDLLEAQKGALDKEFVKMAGNLRRMRTEQLHLKKELSSRQHELELVKQLKEDAISEGDLLRLALEEETKLLDNARSRMKDLESNLRAACENVKSLQKRLEESIAEQGVLRAVNVNLTHTCQGLELETKERSRIKGLKDRFLEFCIRKLAAIKDLEPKSVCFLAYPGHQPYSTGAQRILLYSESNAELLTDVLSSSEPQEVSSPALEGTTEAHDINSALPHAMEDKIGEVPLGTEEATTVQKANGEDLNTVFGIGVTVLKYLGLLEHVEKGDVSLPENVSNVALARNREKDIISPNEKEVEAEFLRLSLGFKCDLFTLEKRVRLEERSRDLAEGNLRKEIAGALKLLESLASLSEDNQAQEIVKKLEKSLELLNQYATRVASKAEMLGAIHQESRVSKAVEVMIQHVENLKRTYTREHAELEELKEALLQSEKSFSPLGERDESPVKKLSSSLKSTSLRRVSIATLPRSTGNAGTGLPLAQLSDTDGNDRNDKFNRRASWSLVAAKQGEKRPMLQRYVSSHSWTESEEEQPETESIPLELPASEVRGNKARKPSEKENSSPRWGLNSVCTRVSSWASCLRTSKAFCISAITALLFALLSSLILGLSFHRPAEAAPVETGDAWTSVQQLLWPYIGLQHQAPPPV